jgi:hypothetical protein
MGSCWCSQSPLAMFTGMLAAKTPDGLLRIAVRAVSAIRRLLPRYNDPDDVCSVTGCGANSVGGRELALASETSAS